MLELIGVSGVGDGFKEKPIVLGFHGCKCDVCALALQGTILQFESSDNCKYIKKKTRFNNWSQL